MGVLTQLARSIASGEAARVVCFAGGVNQVANDISKKLLPGYRGSAIDDYYQTVGDGLRKFCPVPPADNPQNLRPTFQGGQCPVGYRVFVSREVNGEFVPLSNSYTGAGPVGIEQTFNGDEPSQFFITFGGGQFQQLVGSGRGRIDSVERLDGGPDDCGNPPPGELPPGSAPPPSPIGQPDTRIINLPGIGDTEVTFSPTVGPVYVDIDGSVKVPVEVNVTIPSVDVDFNIDVNVDLSDPEAPPEIDPTRPDKDEDGRPVRPDCPVPVTCADEPKIEEPGEEQPAEDEAKGFEVRAALVKSVTPGPGLRATEINQQTGPNIFAPGLGHINFVYEAEDGGQVFSVDFKVKNTNNVIEAPETGLKCIGVVGTPGEGVQWEIFEIRAAGGCSGGR